MAFKLSKFLKDGPKADTLKGDIYQLLMLMRCAYLNEQDAELGTELKGFGQKWDDLLFETKDSLIAMQVKHTTTDTRINLNSLHATKSDKPFSLAKYFDAWIEAKNNEKFKDKNILYIISTNYKIDEKFKQNFESTTFDNQKLFIAGKGEIYKLKEEFIKKYNQKMKRHSKDKEETPLFENIKQYYKLYQEKRKKKKKIKEIKEIKEIKQEDVKTFLKNIIFIVNQPNEKALEEIIKKEISGKYNFVSGQFFDKFFKKFLDWLKEDNKKSKIHSDETINSLFQNIESQINKMYLKGYSITKVKKIKKEHANYITQYYEQKTKEFNILLDTTNVIIVHGHKGIYKNLLLIEALSKTSPKLDWAIIKGKYIKQNYELVSSVLKGDTPIILIVDQPNGYETWEVLVKQLINNKHNHKLVLIVENAKEINFLKNIKHETFEFLRLEDKQLDKILKNYAGNNIKIAKHYAPVNAILSCKTSSLYQCLKLPRYLEVAVNTIVDIPYIKEDNDLYIEQDIVQYPPIYRLHSFFDINAIILLKTNKEIEGVKKCFFRNDEKLVVHNGNNNGLPSAELEENAILLLHNFYNLEVNDLIDRLHSIIKKGTTILLCYKEKFKANKIIKYIKDHSYCSLEHVMDKEKDKEEIDSVKIIGNSTNFYPPIPTKFNYKTPKKTNLNDLSKLKYRKQLNILSADAGTGKTTNLKRLKNHELKVWTKDKFLWEVLISLKDLDIKNTNDPKEYVKRYYKKTLKEWEQECLNLDIDSNNILFLADGLDEVKENNRENVLKFLKRAKQIGSVILTTRSYGMEQTQGYVDNSLQLQIFDDNKIKQYFNERFNKDEKFAKSAIEKLKLNKEKFQDVIGIPLQCYIFCEILMPYYNLQLDDQKVPNLFDNLNKAKLYQLFIKTKIHIFLNEKSGMRIDKTDISDLYRRATPYLNVLLERGFLHIFPEYQNKIPTILDWNYKQLYEQLKQFGLIKNYIRKKDDWAFTSTEPIHRTYFEYFAAAYLLRCFITPKKYNIQFEFAKNIIQKYRFNENYKLVWQFMGEMTTNRDPLIYFLDISKNFETSILKPKDLIGIRQNILMKWIGKVDKITKFPMWQIPTHSISVNKVDKMDLDEDETELLSNQNDSNENETELLNDQNSLNKNRMKVVELLYRLKNCKDENGFYNYKRNLIKIMQEFPKNFPKDLCKQYYEEICKLIIKKENKRSGWVLFRSLFGEIHFEAVIALKNIAVNGELSKNMLEQYKNHVHYWENKFFQHDCSDYLFILSAFLVTEEFTSKIYLKKFGKIIDKINKDKLWKKTLFVINDRLFKVVEKFKETDKYNFVHLLQKIVDGIRTYNKTNEIKIKHSHITTSSILQTIFNLGYHDQWLINQLVKFGLESKRSREYHNFLGDRCFYDSENAWVLINDYSLVSDLKPIDKNAFNVLIDYLVNIKSEKTPYNKILKCLYKLDIDKIKEYGRQWQNIIKNWLFRNKATSKTGLVFLYIDMISSNFNYINELCGKYVIEELENLNGQSKYQFFMGDHIIYTKTIIKQHLKYIYKNFCMNNQNINKVTDKIVRIAKLLCKKDLIDLLNNFISIDGMNKKHIITSIQKQIREKIEELNLTASVALVEMVINHNCSDIILTNDFIQNLFSNNNDLMQKSRMKKDGYKGISIGIPIVNLIKEKFIENVKNYLISQIKNRLNYYSVVDNKIISTLYDLVYFNKVVKMQNENILDIFECCLVFLEKCDSFGKKNTEGRDLFFKFMNQHSPENEEGIARILIQYSWQLFKDDINANIVLKLIYFIGKLTATPCILENDEFKLKFIDNGDIIISSGALQKKQIKIVKEKFQEFQKEYKLNVIDDDKMDLSSDGDSDDDVDRDEGSKDSDKDVTKSLAEKYSFASKSQKTSFKKEDKQKSNGNKNYHVSIKKSKKGVVSKETSSTSNILQNFPNYSNRRDKKLEETNTHKTSNMSKMWYSGHMIIKVWDVFIRKQGLKYSYMGVDDNHATIKDSLFSVIGNGMNLIIKAAIVVDHVGKPYINQKGFSVSICDTMKNDNQNLQFSSEQSNSVDLALKQIKNWQQESTKKEVKNHQLKRHRIIFPYNIVDNIHWCLSVLELSFENNKLTQATITIYNSSTLGGSMMHDSCVDKIRASISHYFPNVHLKVKNNANHPLQQKDGSSCGVITAENGKGYITGAMDYLRTVYERGAFKERQQHIKEVNNDRFTVLATITSNVEIAPRDLPNDVDELYDELLNGIEQLKGKGKNFLIDILLNLDTIKFNNRNVTDHLNILKDNLLKNESQFKKICASVIKKVNHEVSYTDNGIDILNELIDQYGIDVANSVTQVATARTRVMKRKRGKNISEREQLELSEVMPLKKRQKTTLNKDKNKQPFPKQTNINTGFYSNVLPNKQDFFIGKTVKKQYKGGEDKINITDIDNNKNIFGKNTNVNRVDQNFTSGILTSNTNSHIRKFKKSARPQNHFNINEFYEFNKWYDAKILEYLVHAHDKSQNVLKCVFCGERNSLFSEQLDTYLTLMDYLKQEKAYFVAYEPSDERKYEGNKSQTSSIEGNHFIFGMLFKEEDKTNSLLLINPLGKTKHKLFYTTLDIIKKQDRIKHIYVSTTNIQSGEHETMGLVSCDPISAELLFNFTSISLQQLQGIKNIATSSNEHSNGNSNNNSYNSIMDINVTNFLSESLKKLVECKEKSLYIKSIKEIRSIHYELLNPDNSSIDISNEADYWFNCCENALPQVILRRCCGTEKELFANVIEDKNILITSQQSKHDDTVEDDVNDVNMVYQARTRVNAKKRKRAENVSRQEELELLDVMLLKKRLKTPTKQTNIGFFSDNSLPNVRDFICGKVVAEQNKQKKLIPDEKINKKTLHDDFSSNFDRYIKNIDAYNRFVNEAIGLAEVAIVGIKKSQLSSNGKKRVKLSMNKVHLSRELVSHIMLFSAVVGSGKEGKRKSRIIAEKVYNSTYRIYNNKIPLKSSMRWKEGNLIDAPKIS